MPTTDREIQTRHTASRMSKAEHIFIRDNPHLRPLFDKLIEKKIYNVDSIAPTPNHEQPDHGPCCPHCGFIFRDDDYEEYMEHKRLCEIRKKIENVMIHCEVNWGLNRDNVVPFLSFHNHRPMQGNFGEAIPKILKHLADI